MAKVKKKENLTPEERLQVALVPENEQPYKVPGNWCWVKFGAIIELISGRDAKSTDYNSLGRGIPYILGASNLENNVFKIERWIENPQVISLKNDILLSVKGTIGKVYLQKEERINISRQIMSIRTGPSLIPQFTYWFVSNISDSLREVGNGLIPGISREDILQKEVPLPPISEQQRIVDRIESLFAKLDEAKQKAQDAQDSFETRKAAILHKAFTGELTAQWRKEHGVGMESWRRIPLKKCGSWYGGGTPSMRHPEYWENGTLLWITSKDMKNDLIEDTLMHVNMLGVENSSANYIEEPAVLFVMRSGILRRTFPVCMVKKSFTVNQDLKALVPVDDISLEYLFWGCKANEKQILEKCMKSGTTVESINSTALRDFEIPIAESSEQSEIVRIIDNLLAKEQQAKESAERVLGQIDLIKKAILARAFRGELGTNDPNEESAVELVKRILAVELPPKNRTKAVSIPKEVEEKLKSELERKVIKLYFYLNSQSLPINTLMEVSSKKFDVIESIRNLEQRGIIKKLSNGNYKLVR